MRKCLIILFLVALGLFLVLWIKGNDMREIQTEIEIATSPEAVWDVVTDIDKWSEWSPIINQSSGSASLGSELTITMIGKGESNGPNYSPVVTVFEKPTLFRWRGKMISEFMFTNDKVFELVKTEIGTRVIHKELFKGVLVPLFWGKLNESVPSMLDSMNAALKEKLESGAE